MLVTYIFSFSQIVFKKFLSQGREDLGLFDKGLTLYHTIATLRKKAFENIVGKGENAGNQYFLGFPPF